MRSPGCSLAGFRILVCAALSPGRQAMLPATPMSWSRRRRSRSVWGVGSSHGLLEVDWAVPLGIDDGAVDHNGQQRCVGRRCCVPCGLDGEEGAGHSPSEGRRSGEQLFERDAERSGEAAQRAVVWERCRSSAALTSAASLVTRTRGRPWPPELSGELSRLVSTSASPTCRTTVPTPSRASAVSSRSSVFRSLSPSRPNGQRAENELARRIEITTAESLRPVADFDDGRASRARRSGDALDALLGVEILPHDVDGEIAAKARRAARMPEVAAAHHQVGVAVPQVARQRHGRCRCRSRRGRCGRARRANERARRS